MNKPMQVAAIALAAMAMLGGPANAAGSTGGAAQKQRGAQPAKAAKKSQPVQARKRAAPATPAAKAKAAPRRPVAATKAAPKPAARTATAVAKVPPRATGPARAPEVHWSQLPPSRFYPDGIPELRPECLHPLPAQVPLETVAAPRATPHGHPDMLP